MNKPYDSLTVIIRCLREGASFDDEAPASFRKLVGAMARAQKLAKKTGEEDLARALDVLSVLFAFGAEGRARRRLDELLSFRWMYIPRGGGLRLGELTLEDPSSRAGLPVLLDPNARPLAPEEVEELLQPAEMTAEERLDGRGSGCRLHGRESVVRGSTARCDLDSDGR